MSVAVQKTRTLTRVFHQNGARGVLALLRQKFQMTWRRGEVWEVGKFVGRAALQRFLDSNLPVVGSLRS